ncbi:hypothetical protein [Ancylomarina salipaludis]|uniref:hypothetical protein n=1 Tax=Ancylomarina salipaludis TaxID=2501299 RepID=UPI0013E9305B|nr:hypothetical protein [Ancylomarina salipaludis]
MPKLFWDEMFLLLFGNYIISSALTRVIDYYFAMIIMGINYYREVDILGELVDIFPLA